MSSYQKLCTQFYDLDKPQISEEAINFYLSYAKKAKGPILEPMCGSGRYLIPFLRMGFDIDGVDASFHMLEACRKRCKKENLRTNLSQQYIERMKLNRKYALVIIPASSICLLTEQKGVIESLKRIYDYLLPLGHFVFEIETMNARPIQEGQWNGRWVEKTDGSKILLSWISIYNERNKRCENIDCYEHFKRNKLIETEFEELNIKLYEPMEIIHLLEATRFIGIKMLKVYKFKIPGKTDNRIVIECHRT
jgi:hypothetical protein